LNLPKRTKPMRLPSFKKWVRILKKWERVLEAKPSPYFAIGLKEEGEGRREKAELIFCLLPSVL
jgi:hypothetical protein